MTRRDRTQTARPRHHKSPVRLGDDPAVAQLLRSITALRRDRPHAEPCDFLFDLSDELEEIRRNDSRFNVAARQEG